MDFMSGCMHQLSQQSIVWASQSDDFIPFHYLKNLDLIDCAWTALLSGYFLWGGQKREAWEHLMPSFSCGAHRQGAAGWPQIVVRVLDQRKACSAIGKEQTTAVEHTGNWFKDSEWDLRLIYSCFLSQTYLQFPAVFLDVLPIRTLRVPV